MACLFHADDLYDSKIVSKQIQILLNESISSVFTMSRMINDNGAFLESRQSTNYLHHGINRLDFQAIFSLILENNNFIKTPTLMTTKTVINKVGNFRRELFKSSSDLDLWLRMSLLRPIAIINEPLHYYRISHNQASFQIYNNRTEPQDYFKVIDHYLSDKNLQVRGSSRSINKYESVKGAELIDCSVNLFKLNKADQGKILLRTALSGKNFYHALFDLKRTVKYAFGLLVRISLMVGGGKSISIFISEIYRKEKERWSNAK